jgi:hypothetical protein
LFFAIYWNILEKYNNVLLRVVGEFKVENSLREVEKMGNNRTITAMTIV